MQQLEDARVNGVGRGCNGDRQMEADAAVEGDEGRGPLPSCNGDRQMEADAAKRVRPISSPFGTGFSYPFREIVMSSIYQTVLGAEEAEVLEEMRTRLAGSFGVTLNGNRCTIRWYHNDQLVQVSMIVTSVDTPSDGKNQEDRLRRLKALLAKYKQKCPELHEELLYMEFGEWSQ